MPMPGSIQPSIGVKRSTWRVHDPHARAADATFTAARGEVLTRDGGKCCACGFHGRVSGGSAGIEVHHVDDNHHNNALVNLASLCWLCHSYFHVGLVGIQRRGRLVAMPEVSPIEFNQLQRIVWFASWQLSEGSVIENAISSAICDQLGVVVDELAVVLALREQRVISRLGFSDAGVLGGALMGLSDAQFDAISPELERSGLRLWFDETHPVNRDNIVRYVQPGGVFHNVPISTWSAMLRSVLSALKRN